MKHNFYSSGSWFSSMTNFSPSVIFAVLSINANSILNKLAIRLNSSGENVFLCILLLKFWFLNSLLFQAVSFFYLWKWPWLYLLTPASFPHFPYIVKNILSKLYHLTIIVYQHFPADSIGTDRKNLPMPSYHAFCNFRKAILAIFQENRFENFLLIWYIKISDTRCMKLSGKILPFSWLHALQAICKLLTSFTPPIPLE